MKRWQASCLGAVAVLILGGAAMLFVIPFGGAMIAAYEPLFNRLTSYALCPEASAYSFRDYGFGQPTGSSPTAGTGHSTELTCTYEDGSQEIFPNEVVGLKGLAAAFTAAGACSGAVVLLLAAVAAAAAGRLVQPRARRTG